MDFKGKNPVEVKYNSKWLSKLNFADILEISTHFTVPRLLERDMFQERLREGKTVHLHEFLYPVMQAYDSLAMDVDGEVGGNDQTFNMLAGRDLVRDVKNKEKFVLTGKLLTDNCGKKMGKTEGNMIAFCDSSEDMFGKVMSLKDESIITYFIHCTRVSLNEVDKYQKQMAQGANPRDIKIKLAKALVMFYFNTKIADQEEQAFIEQFSKGNVPDDVATFSATSNTKVLEVLVKSGTVSSNSEARRLLKQQAIKVNQKKISDENFGLTSGDIIQIGKRKFLKIK